MPRDEAEISQPGAAAPPTAGRQRRLFSRSHEPSQDRFSLEDALLRNSGRLPALPVANLLGPLAQIVDAAAAGIDELDLTPGGVWIAAGNAGAPAPGAVAFTDASLTQGLPGWLEVPPPDAIHLPNLASAGKIPRGHARFAAPMAALAYELLGGAAPAPGRRYRALPECDEDANALLRGALEGSVSEFADAAAFAAALADTLRRGPPESRDAPSRPATKRRKKRRRVAVKIAEKRGPSLRPALFAMAMLALIALVGWWVRAPKATPGAAPSARTKITPKTTPVPNEDYEAGLNLWNGMGRALIDQPQAVARFQAAAAIGYAPAEAFLAVVYEEGFGRTPKDRFQAMKWAKTSLGAGLEQEAQQGDAEAQLRLGLLYDKGTGVKKDPAKAAELYKEAADQGNASAEYSLGICCINGSGVKKDPARAAALYKESADQGNAFAQNNLAFCYQIGSGVAPDMAKAIELYKKAAAQGHAIAQKNLGVCYFNGIGVEKNLAKAVELYQESADRGNALAEFNLGFCYETGAGVQKDLSKAIALYKKAADQGNDSAENSLGLCYEKGAGVEKDRDKAIAFYIKAADQGNSMAQGRLRGLLHETGK